MAVATAVALRIAPDLALPVDAVTQAMAILARRGAGKTYTASVLVEEVIGAKVPVVVLDPTGAWWGLRSSIDGESPGLPVVIFGGDHGDVPLEPSAGAVLADVVVEHPGAYVLDLSALPSKAAEQRFAADFLERLYRAKKRDTGPLLIVVDEADVFAPQRPGPEQTRTLGALESIVRRGRIKGLGALLITQRAAVLNKNVLTQTEILVAMQTTGPQDIAAVKEWVTGHATKEEAEAFVASLPPMERGEAWVWSPSFLRILQRVRIRARRTFDSSRTPEAGEAAITPVAFAQVDLEQLGARIAATVERVKADDPKELRRRIRQLEAESAARLGVLERRPEPETVEKIVEVPVLTDDQVRDLGEAVAGMRTIIDDLARYGVNLAGIADKITDAALGARRAGEQPPRPIRREQHGRSVRGATSTETEARALPPAPPARAAADGELRLGQAERTFLAAFAQYPQGLSRTRLSLITGYSAKSGHFANVLGRLRSSELIERGDPIRITEAGIAALGGYEPLPAPGDELVNYWRGRLGKAEGAFLSAFTGAYPAALSRDELGALTGYSPASGHFANVLGRLRGLGLVDGWRASDELMGG